MKISETILWGLQQPVLLLDKQLEPSFANGAFCQAFGFEPTELNKAFIEEFISGEACQPPLRTIIDPIAAGESKEGLIETVCTLRTGKRLFLVVNARRIRPKSHPEMILVEPRDVSNEKMIERRVQEINDVLQLRVATVDASNKELEAYGRSVSHDLRTPLRFVSRLAHLLLRSPDTDLSDGASQQVKMILQATNEMTTLIEKLLAFSQAGQEPMRKRRVDMRALFQQAVKEVRQAKEEDLDAEVVIEELAPCQGDATLLKEVAMNLVSNALKFTQPRRKARITIGCSDTEVETAYFVKDNGVGFDMSEADSLFVPFLRLHNTADFEGAGIGLALAKRIIERHGGRIWAVSEVGKGAAFYFTLGLKVAG